MRYWLSSLKNWLLLKFKYQSTISRNHSNLMERLSHELRTSLTGIIGYSEFVESSSTEPMVNFTAKIIRESSLGLARASNSFLDLHRLSSGQIKMVCSIFSIGKLVRDIVQVHQKQALNQGGALVFTCPDETFFTDMNADEQRVHQVVDALIFNAVQFAGQGKFIHVNIFLDEDEFDHKSLIILLDGPSDREHMHLYQEFWSGEHYKFRLQAGPGVELALAKELIHLLQGEADYRIDSDERSRLQIRLPIQYKKRKVNV